MTHKICVIFDLDDTLTDCQWRAPLLDPLPGETKKNWSAFFGACGEDPERERLVAIAQDFIKAGAHVVVLTGRQESYRDISERWLNDRAIAPAISHFRPNHNFRPDHTLKEAWVRDLQAQGYEFIAAFDDRLGNVEAFRKLGILSANALDDAEVETVAAEGLALLDARLAAVEARSKKEAPRPFCV